MVLQKLALLTAEKAWQEAAERQIRFCTDEIRRYPVGYSFALMALSIAFYSHRELVCVVKKDILKYAPFTAAYPMPEAEPTYYLCENGMCKMPVTSEEVVKTWILGNNPNIL